MVEPAVTDIQRKNTLVELADPNSPIRWLLTQRWRWCITVMTAEVASAKLLYVDPG